MSNLPELNPESYLNRELSWIEFNRRVLAEAQDPNTPLLERLRFIGIFASNLDEFFMVRVATHHQKSASSRTRPDGYTAATLLDEIGKRVRAQTEDAYATFKHVLQELSTHNIHIREVKELSPAQQQALRDYFAESIYPILTPLAVDHARPFPFISNLSLNMVVLLRRDSNSKDEEFVRLKLPEILPRMINVSQIAHKYGGITAPTDTVVWLEDVISNSLDQLFPGMEVIEQGMFRVTRNADIDYEHEQEDSNGDIDVFDLIEASVLERRFGDVVRLSVPNTISQRLLLRLIDELEVHPDRDVHVVPGPLGLHCLFGFVGQIDRPDLKYPSYTPRNPIPIGKNLFAAIRDGDILMHHPYDTFAPVEEFFRAAANDPDVLAIKATLYRVGRNSPIVQALMEARDNDKQVAVLVELKARFDEQNNLEWARALENKGVHVTYGVEELPVKTHAKIALVVRNEPDGVRRYVHLSTGNYNSGTARIYTDLGLFTCNREIADDASRLFNRLTGYAPGTSYKQLLVAPEFLLPGLLQSIDHEIAAAKAGKPAHMIFKMNQLEEDQMIRKLYEASQAGVQIDLIVRGLCCLRPGVVGLSENIRVNSIVGRFLEHSRIFYFHNAPPERQIYLGSADLMRRNLYNRVEVVFPILDDRVRTAVLRVLHTCRTDNQKAWRLQNDGTYLSATSTDGQQPTNSQTAFMEDSHGLAF